MSEDTKQEPQPSTNSSEMTSDAEGQFDASAFEADFGMEEGSLAEATDKESAMEIIRQHADKVLTAGYTAPPPAQSDDAPKSQPKQATDETGTKAKPSGNEEYDKLRAEVNELKTKLQQNEQNQVRGLYQEVDRRIAAEIDKWDSPKYGKGDSRSFNQIKAFNELRDMVGTHVAGYTAQGKQPPTIEKVLRQVRAFHDSDSGGTKPKQDAKPLGTPGATRSPEGGDQPKSIHHALIGNKF